MKQNLLIVCNVVSGIMLRVISIQMIGTFEDVSHVLKYITLTKKITKQKKCHIF